MTAVGELVRLFLSLSRVCRIERYLTSKGTPQLCTHLCTGMSKMACSTTLRDVSRRISNPSLGLKMACELD